MIIIPNLAKIAIYNFIIIKPLKLSRLIGVSFIMTHKNKVLRQIRLFFYLTFQFSGFSDIA